MRESYRTLSATKHLQIDTLVLKSPQKNPKSQHRAKLRKQSTTHQSNPNNNQTLSKYRSKEHVGALKLTAGKRVSSFFLMASEERGSKPLRSTSEAESNRESRAGRGGIGNRGGSIHSRVSRGGDGSRGFGDWGFGVRFPPLAIASSALWLLSSNGRSNRGRREEGR